MITTNFASKPVSKITANELSLYVYENRDVLSSEMKVFYQDVVGFINMQLSKKAKYRMTMKEIFERSYNIESYVLASGAASFETGFIKI